MSRFKRIQNNKLLKQTITYSLSDGLSRAIPFAVMPILAFYLDPSEFGIASNFMVFMTLISSLMGFSTYSYYSVHYYNIEEARKKKLAFNLITTNVFAFFLCLLLPLFFGNQFEEIYFIPLFWQLLGVLMGLTQLIFDLFTTYLRLQEKPKLFLRYKTISTLLSSVLSLVFVIGFKWSWEGRVLALVLTSVSLSLLSVYIFRKNGMFNAKFDLLEIKSIVKYGFPLIPHKVSSSIVRGVERGAITRFGSINDTGLFAFAQTMTSVLQMFSVAFLNAFSPHVYKQLSEDTCKKDIQSAVKRGLVRNTYFVLGLFGVILILVYLSLTVLISAVFTQEYASSIAYLPFFFLAAFFGFAYNLVSVYIFYSKKVRYFGLVSVAVGLSSVILNIMVIKQYGATGAAYTVVLTSMLKFVASGIYSQKVFPMPWIISNWLTN